MLKVLIYKSFTNLQKINNFQQAIFIDNEWDVTIKQSKFCLNNVKYFQII